MESAAGYRLSPQQRDVWSLQRVNAVCVSQCAVSIAGPFDVSALRRACEAVVNRHEILRTTFHRQPGMKWPLQVIHDRLDPVWAELNATTQSIDERLATERQAPFDIERGPVIRFTLASKSSAEHCLLVTVPALLADAMSLENLIKDLCGQMANQTNDSADAPLQYADYSEWRNELAASDEGDAAAAKKFWNDQNALGSLTPTLPYQRKPADDSNPIQDTLRVVLTNETQKTLDSAVQSLGVSKSEFALTCWETLVWRLTGSAEFIIRHCFSGRGPVETRAALGHFSQFLPVPARIENKPFAELLAQVKSSLETANRCQDYFTIQEDTSAVSPGIAFESREVCSADQVGDAKFVISRVIESTPFSIKLHCDWNDNAVEFHFDSQRFARADIERICQQFLQLLGQFSKDPKTLTGAAEILTAPERLRLLVELNRTNADYPRDVCIHEMFERQAEKVPDLPGLVCDGKRWTYRELNGRANQVAHLLQNHGVKKGDRVGLCMERSGESIIGLLGILKAGAAYVPIHPEQPKARLAFQLTETRAPVVLTQDSLRSALPDFKGVVFSLDSDAAKLDSLSKSNPERCSTPDDVVYVIYTSGSTGTPKGVAVTHRNLVSYSHYMCTRLKVEPGLNFATVSTLSADLGNTCVFPSLISGGCLHVIPYEMAMDGKRVADYAARQPIDILKITPSHLQALMASADSGSVLPRKCLILGGEASTWELLEQVKAKSSCATINHYGPTETTVGSLTFDTDVNYVHRAMTSTVPVGRPIANTQVFVLDSQRQPVSMGVIGELYIAGDGVAQGYLNQPEHTAERFVTNPFTDSADSRMYRTGDQARYLPDGNIEFLGRIDHQVKIRGFRVELAEVEAVLTRHPLVRKAVVTARDDKSGGKSLVAYLVSHSGRSIALDEVRPFLAEHLPHYMIPSTVVTLDEIPLTANGKIDRHALPDPDQIQSAAKTHVAARNPVEETLAGIWAKILDVKQVSVEDDFFELGGHSLLATQVVSRVRGALDVDLPLRCIFESPTVAKLADVISGLQQAMPAGPDVDQMLEELEGLSEEEVQRILAMEMQEGVSGS